ncbi:MAG: carboxy terminal-processing peptidase [Kiritimatiellae bacterium]|nr:carboxy terminal-processing peptidase [Kiritimatiellia bacterium]
MKTFKIFLTSLCFFVASSLYTFADLAPKDYYGEIAKRMVNMLPKYHVLTQRVDDVISAQAWTNVITTYDYDRSVFLKSDIDSFVGRKFLLDDELKKGDVRFAYLVYNTYIERLTERMFYATNFLINAEVDFTKKENYLIDRKQAQWPADKAAAEDHWRKRLTNELLAQIVSAELEANKTTNIFSFADALATARTNLVKRYHQYSQVMKDPDDEQVLQTYLSSVCRAYDPHTDYMSPTLKEDFDIDMNLTLCGVGAVLQLDEGALKIVEIVHGGPLDRDGRIKEGDKIVGVRKSKDAQLEDITWQPMRKTIKKIRGPKGTVVTLEIVPRGDVTGAKRQLVDIVRDEIKLDDMAATGHVEKVVLNGVTNNLGYVYLPSFYGSMDKRPGEKGYRSCAFDVAKYIAEFNAEDVGGLLLDLRGNGGGSLMEAVMLSALFVHSGPVVQVSDAVNSTRALSIPYGNPVAFFKPIVVLTDRASASASEIVAAHLHDTGRAIVLGDARTHGKGTVQTVMRMGPETFGSMKLTTARFYRINGESTQIEGMPADIKLPSPLDALEIGEDKLPNALPFTKIEPARYSLSWNLYTYAKELSRNAEKRLAENDKYQRHLRNIEEIRKVAQRKEVPLDYATRKEMMLADEKLHQDDDNKEEPPSRKRRKKKDSKDVVLSTAFDILADLVRLNGQSKLPGERRWWE